MFAENEKIYRFEQHALAIDLEKIYGVYIVNLIIIMLSVCANICHAFIDIFYTNIYLV